MSKKISLSIISPAHNESGLIKDFVTNALSFLRREKIDGEVVVVENGSRDNTLEILRNLTKGTPNLVVESLPVGNKGLALKRGMEVARGEYLITLDTDLWDEEFVKLSVEGLLNHEIVVGSKAIRGASDQRPIFSRLMNLGYNFIFKIFFNFKGTETHALLSFRRDKILPLVKKCVAGDLVFDTELLIRAEREGLSKLEIPATVREIRNRRYSLINQLARTVRNFITLLVILKPSFSWPIIVLAFALLLGVFFRFLNYQDWFFFSVDEEHYSYMTRMITAQHHFPLIGGPISGTKLYMAPWFLYFNAIFFVLSNNNPVVSGVIFTILEFGVIYFIYLIGKKLFSPLAGALGALLYSASFLMAIFDRHFWNITLTPLISVVTFYALLRFREGSGKWLVVAALVAGFGLSSTFSTFAIFLFVAVVLVISRRWRGLTLFLGIIAVMHVTLVFFDLRHDFWLTRGLFEFLTLQSAANMSLAERLTSTVWQFSQTLGKALVIASPVNVSDETSICYQGIDHYVPAAWSILLAIVILVRKQWLVLLLATVNIFSLVLFRADPQERHFLPFLPLFFVLAGAFFVKVRQAMLVIPVIVAINIISLVNSYALHGLPTKIAAVKSIMSQTKPGDFDLSVEGNCHRWGYRYLFSQFNHEPASSYLDQDFSWMYEVPSSPNRAKVNVTIFSPDEGAIKVSKERYR